GHTEGNVAAGSDEPVESGKGLGSHADDGEDDSVQAQSAAGGGPVGGVILAPEIVAEDREGLGGRRHFLGAKDAAGDGRHAGNRKEVVAHQDDEANLRRREWVGGNREGGDAVGGEAAEGAAPGTQ